MIKSSKRSKCYICRETKKLKICKKCGKTFCKNHIIQIKTVKVFGNKKLVFWYNPFVGHQCKFEYEEEKKEVINAERLKPNIKPCSNCKKEILNPIDKFPCVGCGDTYCAECVDKQKHNCDSIKVWHPEPEKTKKILYCIECKRGGWFRKPKMVDTDTKCAYCKKPVCDKHLLSRKHDCPYLGRN